MLHLFWQFPPGVRMIILTGMGAIAYLTCALVALVAGPPAVWRAALAEWAAARRAHAAANRAWLAELDRHDRDTLTDRLAWIGSLDPLAAPLAEYSPPLPADRLAKDHEIDALLNDVEPSGYRQALLWASRWKGRE